MESTSDFVISFMKYVLWNYATVGRDWEKHAISNSDELAEIRTWTLRYEIYHLSTTRVRYSDTIAGWLHFLDMS
jgi:hypothetical protein